MPTGLGDEIFWMCPSLESNPVDLSPSARTLTLNNGTALVNDSSEGGSKAYEFDGSDDTITTTTIWGAGLRRLSWSIWSYNNHSASDFNSGPFFEYTGENGGTAGVYARLGNQYSNPRQYHCGVIGTLDSGGFGSIASPFIQTLADAIAAGWQHWAFVWDDTTAYTYVNGILITTQATNPGVTTFKYGNPVTFGKWFNYFNGKIDDFRAYDHAISQSEIEHLASARGVLGELGGTHIQRTLLGVG